LTVLYKLKQHCLNSYLTGTAFDPVVSPTSHQHKLMSNDSTHVTFSLSNTMLPYIAQARIKA
jgi:hypothetical protein